MYAIVKAGGHQEKVEVGDVILVNRLEAKKGETVEFPVALVVDGAKVPLGEMFGYSTDLRSQTQGRASYTMQFDSYEPAPKSIVDEVMSKNA